METSLKLVETELSCIECNRTGDLVKCLTCGNLFHPICCRFELIGRQISPPFCKKCQSLGGKFSKPNDWVVGLMFIHNFILTKFYGNSQTNSSETKDLFTYLKHHVHSDCMHAEQCTAAARAQEIMVRFVEVFSEIFESEFPDDR